jgi:hypothetical protein
MPPTPHATATRRKAGHPDDPTPRTVVGRPPNDDGQSMHVGAYRARDGTTGAPVAIDCEHPHVVTVVGKRGSGKSHTVGVLAEGLAATTGVTPIVVDPMGEFSAFATATDGITPSPRVTANSLPPRAWCDLLDLDPTSATGSLVWRAATETTTLQGMLEHVANAAVDDDTRRAATNHLALADDWNVFHPDAPTPTDLLTDGPVVLDCSTHPRPAANAICHATAANLYHTYTTLPTTPTPDHPDEHHAESTPNTLPWLVIDEAHVFYDGTARPALETILTRGRTPGISLLTATQRPSAIPTLAHSQTDLTIAHNLTNGHDRSTLANTHPTRTITDNLPTTTGDALLIDDATTTTHHVHVRDRHTPHHGTTPTATTISNNHLTHRDH